MKAQQLIEQLQKFSPETSVIDVDGLTPNAVELEDGCAVLIFDSDHPDNASVPQFTDQAGE